MQKLPVKAELRVIQRLRSHGFDAKPIPRCVKKTADIRAFDGAAEYVIEVKEKDLAEVFQKQLASSGGFDGQQRMRSNPNLIKKLIKGAEQLRSSIRQGASSLSVLWIVITNESTPEIAERTILLSLFGIREIRCTKGDHRYDLDCFYADHSFFALALNVAAVVIENKEGLIFCLNDQSPHREAFLASKMLELPKLRIVDATHLERTRCALINPVDPTGDAIEDRITQLYGFDLAEFITTMECFGVRHSVFQSPG